MKIAGLWRVWELTSAIGAALIVGDVAVLVVIGWTVLVSVITFCRTISVSWIF
jgi:hypothetical protein